MSSPGSRRGLAAVAGLLLAIGVAVAILVLQSSGSTHRAPRPTSPLARTPLLEWPDAPLPRLRARRLHAPGTAARGPPRVLLALPGQALHARRRVPARGRAHGHLRALRTRGDAVGRALPAGVAAACEGGARAPLGDCRYHRVPRRRAHRNRTRAARDGPVDAVASPARQPRLSERRRVHRLRRHRRPGVCGGVHRADEATPRAPGRALQGATERAAHAAQSAFLLQCVAYHRRARARRKPARRGRADREAGRRVAARGPP